jgi:hypothetical protein
MNAYRDADDEESDWDDDEADDGDTRADEGSNWLSRTRRCPGWPV